MRRMGRRSIGLECGLREHRWYNFGEREKGKGKKIAHDTTTRRDETTSPSRSSRQTDQPPTRPQLTHQRAGQRGPPRSPPQSSTLLAASASSLRSFDAIGGKRLSHSPPPGSPPPPRPCSTAVLLVVTRRAPFCWFTSTRSAPSLPRSPLGLSVVRTECLLVCARG
jgi:hypothetical protein